MKQTFISEKYIKKTQDKYL